MIEIYFFPVPLSVTKKATPMPMAGEVIVLVRDMQALIHHDLTLPKFYTLGNTVGRGFLMTSYSSSSVINKKFGTKSLLEGKSFVISFT